MLEAFSRTRRLLAYVSILTTSFAVMYTTIFQVINYNIYEAFPKRFSTRRKTKWKMARALPD